MAAKDERFEWSSDVLGEAYQIVNSARVDLLIEEQEDRDTWASAVEERLLERFETARSKE